jgi:hypothetical protein
MRLRKEYVTCSMENQECIETNLLYVHKLYHLTLDLLIAPSSLLYQPICCGQMSDRGPDSQAKTNRQCSRSDRKIERTDTNDRGYVGRTSRYNRRDTSVTLILFSALWRRNQPESLRYTPCTRIASSLQLYHQLLASNNISSLDPYQKSYS